MILPIGHEEASTRRLPWVSFSIIALCTAVFLFTDTESANEIPDRLTTLQRAAEYWRDHAYLEADPEVLAEVAYDTTPNQRSQYVEILRETARGMEPSDPELWMEEQEELDRLTALAQGRLAPPDTADSDNPFARFGYTPASPRALPLLTHMFVHAGWLHLLGNLFMFFLAAPAIEDRYGRPLFAGFYLLAGVFACLFYAALTHDPTLPLVGASGAIAGVLGVFLVRFWSSRIRFLYFFFFGFRVFTGTFDAPAYLMLPLWFANEVLQGWIVHSMGISGGVAYWAHVGGFLFGAAAGLAVWQLKLEERFIDSAIEAKVTLATGNPVVEQAMQAREDGDFEAAYTMLEAELTRTPEDPDVPLVFWDVATACGRAEDGVPALAGMIRQLVRDGGLEPAARHWADMTNVVPGALLDPATLVKLLPALSNSDRQVTALRHAVDPGQSELTAGMALRVLDLARELDPPTALRAARRALSFDGIHEGKRAKIEALVHELEAAGVDEPVDVETAAARVAEPAWNRNGAIELDPDWEEDLRADPRGSARDVASLDGRTLDADALAAAPALALCPESGRVDAGAPEDLSPPPLPGTPHPALESPPPVPPPLPDPPAEPAPPELDLDTRAPLFTEIREEPVPDVDSEANHVELDVDFAGELPRFHDVKVAEARPTALAADALVLRSAGGREARIEYGRIQAVAAAAVRGLSRRIVVVVDLALNWNETSEAPLRVVRLRSDQFDPLRLIPAADRMAAFRGLLQALLERTGAVPLPDAEAAQGSPFATCDDLAAYERDVLQVDV